jgi:hypothetical protein
MEQQSSANRSGLVAELHSAHADVTARQRRLLEIVAECDRTDVWSTDGCRDLARWLSSRLGISNWEARRWITAAHALPRLPLITAAFEAGDLCLAKVQELCRFATAETEKRLITWGRRVTVAGIRRKADLANRAPQEDVVEADRTRFLRYWWFDDGRRFGLEGALPADCGAVVAKALDRLANRVPDIIDEDHVPIPSEESLDARRADALVAMASSQIACDQDPDRATVVVHAELDALLGDDGSCEIEGGPVIHPETGRRLSCDARLQVVLHDRDGHVVGIGRVSRTAPPWLKRQLLHRDRGCTFSGCECRRWLHAHHIHHWTRGGETNIDNLILVCTFHHKFLHEYGWTVQLDPSGAAHWFRPNGKRFGPDVSPRREVFERAPPMEQLVSVA